MKTGTLPTAEAVTYFGDPDKEEEYTHQRMEEIREMTDGEFNNTFAHLPRSYPTPNHEEIT